MTGDLPRLAMAARAGDLAAVRDLHFPQRTNRENFADTAAWFALAAQAAPELAKRLDGHTPPRQPARPRPGGIDFARLHALAMDNLPELLGLILPDGHEGGSWGGRWCWIGCHPERPEPVHVDLLVGVWNEPNTGRTGLDLPGLYSLVFGLPQGRGARLLAEWLGAEMHAYAG